VKLNQLKQVLELYGHFSGINRKIQLKYLPKGLPKKSGSEEGSCVSTSTSKSLLMPTYVESTDVPAQPSLLLIVKWGGQLTQTGKNQAEVLGKVSDVTEIEFNGTIAGLSQNVSRWTWCQL
jgi:inositol-hexakisphosphate/diphosphoinositol-pentakisphosphate 1-kinase